MKKIIVIACALLALSATASAQFMNSGASSSSKSSGASWVSGDHPKTFGTFSLTYSPVNAKTSNGNSSMDILEAMGMDASLNALSLNWTNAHNVLATQPLYVEYGVGLQWAFASDSQSEEGIDVKTSVNLLSLKVPVSVVYDFAIPSTSISVAPYAGLNLSGYLLGQAKQSWEYTGEYADYADEPSGEESYSWFSKDDMGGDPWSRFILGWHIGARIGFNKFFLGIAYEGPITNFYSNDGVEIYSNQVNISLGMKF